MTAPRDDDATTTLSDPLRTSAPAGGPIPSISDTQQPASQSTLAACLNRLGPDELALRAANGRRILREHGVSIRTNITSGTTETTWDLDLIPYLIAADEWSDLEAGLVQRARLLNLILADLFGVQRLVRDGFIPAPLVFANPGYWRACQAVRVPGGCYLQTYAADVTRGPDGRWIVLADRTQSPAGLGFTLENRSVLARVLPELSQTLRPRPLVDTLRLRLDALRRLAPASTDNPAIALLTPGARNPAYFEQAYLARLLGLALVEGADLTVRDRRVFLKTLDGLRPVHVLWRCLADAFCDPLELRGDSLLGVPGLVEATRAGQVAVANTLGSGLLESPGFVPFLPSLAPHLLDEDLRLPSLPTWWCGHPRDLHRIRNHLDSLVLRSAFASPNPIPTPASILSNSDPRQLQSLTERPYDFVAQTPIPLELAPVVDGTPCPIVLRLFVIFDGPNYRAVPGGLAGLHSTTTAIAAPLPFGNRTKDVWILPADSEPAPTPLTVTSPPPELERLASDLPSRTAENLFWLGRYTERLEHLLRLARAGVDSIAEETDPNQPAAFLDLLARLGPYPPPESLGPPPLRLQHVLLDCLYSPPPYPGVRDLLDRVQTAAFGVRDRLSADTWRILRRLDDDAGPRPSHAPLIAARSTLNTLILDLAAFSGMEMENMTRGYGWAFLDLGRRIERAIATARLIQTTLDRTADVPVRNSSHQLHDPPPWTADVPIRSTKREPQAPPPAAPPAMTPPHEPLLEPLLEIADSAITYRRRYFAEPRLDGVLDLLLFDPANPRSVAFQIDVLHRHLAGLPASFNPEGIAQLHRILATLTRWFSPNPGTAPSTSTSSVPQPAPSDLANLARDLGTLSDLVTQVFFSHALPSAR